MLPGRGRVGQHIDRCIRNDGVGVNQAARNFSVPASTLKDRLSGRVEHGKNFGPVPYLSSEEEAELIEFLTKCAAMGLGKTKREVFNIVERVLKKKGCNVDHVKVGGLDFVNDTLRFLCVQVTLSLGLGLTL